MRGLRKGSSADGDCVGLNKKGPPEAHRLNHLFTREWHYLRRMSKCVLVGGSNWGWALKFSKAHSFHARCGSFFLLPTDLDVDLQHHLCLCVTVHHRVPHHDVSNQTSGTVSKPRLWWFEEEWLPLGS